MTRFVDLSVTVDSSTMSPLSTTIRLEGDAPRRGRGHHGGADQSRRAAPAPRRRRRCLLQDRGYRGRARALFCMV